MGYLDDLSKKWMTSPSERNMGLNEPYKPPEYEFQGPTRTKNPDAELHSLMASAEPIQGPNLTVNPDESLHRLMGQANEDHNKAFDEFKYNDPTVPSSASDGLKELDYELNKPHGENTQNEWRRRNLLEKRVALAKEEGIGSSGASGNFPRASLAIGAALLDAGAKPDTPDLDLKNPLDAYELSMRVPTNQAEENQRSKAEAQVKKNDAALARIYKEFKDEGTTDARKAELTEEAKQYKEYYDVKTKELTDELGQRSPHIKAEGDVDRFTREQSIKRANFIREDLKTLGLEPTLENKQAMNNLRSLGMNAFDLQRARTQWSKDGRGFEWSELSINEKVGYANLHHAKQMANIDTGMGLQGLNYKGRADDVAAVKILDHLVEIGEIRPDELVDDRTGNHVPLNKTVNGRQRINIDSVEEIIFRKQRDLRDAETHARMLGADAEAEAAKQRLRDLEHLETIRKNKAKHLQVLEEAGKTTVNKTGVFSGTMYEAILQWETQKETIDKMPENNENQIDKKEGLRFMNNNFLSELGIGPKYRTAYLFMKKEGLLNTSANRVVVTKP